MAIFMLLVVWLNFNIKQIAKKIQLLLTIMHLSRLLLVKFTMWKKTSGIKWLAFLMLDNNIQFVILMNSLFLFSVVNVSKKTLNLSD